MCTAIIPLKLKVRVKKMQREACRWGILSYLLSWESTVVWTVWTAFKNNMREKADNCEYEQSIGRIDKENEKNGQMLNYCAAG